MPIQFACPNCGQSLTSSDDAAGQTVSCPKCKSNLIIGGPTRNPELLPTQKPDRGIGMLSWALIGVCACVPIALVIAIVTGSRNRGSNGETTSQVTPTANSPSEPTSPNVVQNTPRPRTDPDSSITATNPTMGDLHKILVPAGYLVDTYGSNMAWKKGNEAIYFEVSGSGNGQIEREITVLTLFRGNNEIWSSRHIKIDSNKIYFLNDGGEWVQINTEAGGEAGSTGASGTETAAKDGRNTGRPSFGDRDWAPPEHATPSQKAITTGRVKFSLVQTLKDSWRREGWRQKSKAEQAGALALMIVAVKTDIEDPADQEATLDYIQQTIGSW